MNTLPYELKLKIVLYTDIRDLQSLYSTNRHFHTILNKQELEIKQFFINIYIPEYRDPTNFLYTMYHTRYLDYNDLFKTYISLYDIKDIDCSNRLVSSFPVFLHLEYLRCIGCRTRTLQHFPKLKHLDCDNNRLGHIPEYDTLEHLSCSRNYLFQINEYPSLRFLSCKYNAIHRIANMDNLEELYCDENLLLEFPRFLKLEILTCKTNLILNLPSFPNLKELHCEENFLTQICNMPRLQDLYCSQNRLLYILDNLPMIYRIQCDPGLVANFDTLNYLV